uniref:Uncharacterized protein n=1 Tax=Solanum tuberosum TaxID=4113 RepID=M1CM36_SOLTU
MFCDNSTKPGLLFRTQLSAKRKESNQVSMLKLVLYSHVNIYTYKSIRDQNQHIRNLHQTGTVEEIAYIKKDC